MSVCARRPCSYTHVSLDLTGAGTILRSSWPMQVVRWLYELEHNYCAKQRCCVICTCALIQIMVVFAGKAQRLSPQASTPHTFAREHMISRTNNAARTFTLQVYYLTELNLKPWVIIGSVLAPITVVVEQLHSEKDVLHSLCCGNSKPPRYMLPAADARTTVSAQPCSALAIGGRACRLNAHRAHMCLLCSHTR